MYRFFLLPRKENQWLQHEQGFCGDEIIDILIDNRSQNTSMSYDKEAVFRPNADVSKFGVNRIATK